MITKEQFLDGTTEDELFSLIHEVLFRLRDLRKEDNPEGLDKEIVFFDKEIGVIAEQMITEIKGKTWLGKGEGD